MILPFFLTRWISSLCSFHVTYLLLFLILDKFFAGVWGDISNKFPLSALSIITLRSLTSQVNISFNDGRRALDVGMWRRIPGSSMRTKFCELQSTLPPTKFYQLWFTLRRRHTIPATPTVSPSHCKEGNQPMPMSTFMIDCNKRQPLSWPIYVLLSHSLNGTPRVIRGW